MRKTLPVIAEDTDTLKQRLQHAHHGRKKPWPQMLYMLASGQAHTRQDVAQLLGVHRNTMGHWLAIYEAGGLAALLEVYVPAGKPISPPPDVLGGLEQALQQPAGFASYEALRQWVKQRYQRDVTYHILYTIVRTRFNAKLKVPRPSHTKKPVAIEEFQTGCRQQLRRVIPPITTLPVRVFSQDESRFGLLPVRRRRLTARGVQPIGAVQPIFEWLYVYGAVAPTTGERFFLALPHLNAEGFPLFIDACAQAFADSLNLLLLDKSGAHMAQRLMIPATVRLVFLPPYCPELNPIERVWRDLKDDIAWKYFSDLNAPQEYVCDLLQAYEASTLRSLTGYAYLIEAINALSS